MKPYPIFLCDLDRRRCVVIGGDHEAQRKVGGLLEVDAKVVVISEALTPGLRAMADEGRVEWIPRDYEEGDLEGAFLVIVSERNPERTEPIWQEANREGALINAMDDVPHCTFVAGSTIRRGPLVVSISTSGAAPAVAVRLRQTLEQRLGPEYGEYLELLASLREEMVDRYPDFDERRGIWYELADSRLLDLVREGRQEEALRRIEALSGIVIPADLVEEDGA
ncbi:MAG TPA: bifunctional precorrin-2 dehydrogenase/sirohydrochlorin ferrochelatase [Rhodothermales bacterium]|nr:bifunctional precorrin-2 dehydrogenase/sirohydrochlorin ferrochelatase [Rhodothermales bacterium]